MSARHDAPRGRVLVVLHQEHSCPARIGRLLHTMGYELDARRPRFGDPLPDTLAHHAGAIIFGGPMSVNDPDEWLRREIDFVGVALKENAPLLGVCLGGQMIAKHLGVRVAPHREGLAEIGYYPIAPTQAGHDICAAPFPEHVYQWHFEGFELPPGADLLARGTTFENQAFRFGSAVACSSTLKSPTPPSAAGRRARRTAWNRRARRSGARISTAGTPTTRPLRAGSIHSCIAG